MCRSDSADRPRRSNELRWPWSVRLFSGLPGPDGRPCSRPSTAAPPRGARSGPGGVVRSRASVLPSWTSAMRVGRPRRVRKVDARGPDSGSRWPEHAVWDREAMPDRVLDASASAHPGSARPVGALVVTNFSVILSLSFCHLLNDTMQSLVPALYPILKASYGLSFAQVGFITLAPVHRLDAPAGSRHVLAGTRRRSQSSTAWRRRGISPAS